MPQLHPVVPPHVLHFRHVPFRTSVKFPHSPHASPSYPCALASARFSAASALASARTSALLGDHGRGSSPSAAFSAVAPSTWPWARPPASAVILGGAAPPRLASLAAPPPAGEGEERPPRSVWLPRSL